MPMSWFASRKSFLTTRMDLCPRYSGTQTDWNWICFLNRNITFLPYHINATSVVSSILLLRMHFLILFLISWDRPCDRSFVHFVSAAVVLCKLFQKFIKALLLHFYLILKMIIYCTLTIPFKRFFILMAFIYGFLFLNLIFNWIDI